jgi:hypothetical protein
LESGSIGEFLTAITTLGCKESLLAVHKRDLNNTNQIIEVDELGLVKNIFWRESSEVFLEVAKRNQVGMVDVDSGIYYFSNLASNVLKTPCNTVGVSEGLLPQLIRNNMLRAVPWNGLRFAIDTGEKLKIARNAFINHPGKF